MRKPRDFDAELKALTDKARQLKSRKQNQLGELVIATGADALAPEELAGALIAAVSAERATREAWRKRGATFFRDGSKGAGDRAGKNQGSVAQGASGAAPASGETSAA